jgi:two-component system, OmpR family, phosphate regulon response regulator PhoB
MIKTSLLIGLMFPWEGTATMTRQRILIIEEEGGRADELSMEFEREGHETMIARDGDEGVRLAKALFPDRIVLDMPIADCLDLCWRLGDIEGTREIPVFMAAQDEAAVTSNIGVASLETSAGVAASDQLVMRLTALRNKRRPPVNQSQVLEYRGVRIDLMQHQAYSNGTKIDLTPTEFRLLECFLRQPGRAFSRSQLLDGAISKGNLVLERTIDCHVKSLRRKLNSNRVVIETVRGIGYRFRDPRD